MQTIIGTGGAIGVELAKALITYTDEIRLVSRTPAQVNGTDQLFPADVMKGPSLRRAVEGSAVVYVTVGFQYNYKVWRAQWPLFMTNIIAACKDVGAKLVFFDNMYMYDRNHLGHMTEATPINPSSEKGKIRAEIAQQLMDEVEAGKLTALIARSADYYGPNITNTSMLTETVINRLRAGKSAQWIKSLDFIHSMTFVPDAGKATAMLGNTDEAFNQVWHLPTHANPPTGREWVTSIATELKVKPKVQVISQFMMKSIGIFVPILKEISEMSYQYDRDYIFSSKKFDEYFNFTPTLYEIGIKEIVEQIETN